MARTSRCASILLIAGMTLATAACDRSAPAAPDTASDVTTAAPDVTPPTPAAGEERLSPDAWNEQARQSATAATPEDVAAEAAAAGRAMAEVCGFSETEMQQLVARETAEGRGPGFEARVAAHMPRLRQVQQTQRRENEAAYQENCEFLRFMQNNRG